MGLARPAHHHLLGHKLLPGSVHAEPRPGALDRGEGPGAWFSMDRARQEFVTQQMVMGRAREAAAGAVPGGVAVPGGARRSLAPVVGAPGASASGAGGGGSAQRKAAALGSSRGQRPGGAAPVAARPSSSSAASAGG